MFCYHDYELDFIGPKNRGVAGNGRAHSLSVRANTNIQCVPFGLKGSPCWKEQEPIKRRAKTALRRQSPDTKGGKVVPAQCRSQFPKISVSRAAKQRRALPQPMYFPQFCRKLEKKQEVHPKYPEWQGIKHKSLPRFSMCCFECKFFFGLSNIVER